MAINNMTIFVFGNADLKGDSLPLEILPELNKEFPNITFELKDPNEEWDIPNNLIIIDTVVGIKKITVYNDILKFDNAPRVSMHDFDAFANIRLLMKLGKIDKIKIIGIPVNISKKKAISEIVMIINSLYK